MSWTDTLKHLANTVVISVAFGVIVGFPIGFALSYKADKEREACGTMLRSNLLFEVAQQRFELEGMKVKPQLTVHVPERAPRDMRMALMSLNNSIETNNYLAVKYRKRYEEMLDRFEKKLKSR